MENKNHVLKRVLACVMVVIMAVTAVPMSGFVGLELPKWSEMFATKASAATSGLYTYTVVNGNAIITGVSSSISGEVVIPDTLDGCKVTNIARKAFNKCSNIEKVIINSPDATVSMDAFYACNNIQSISVNCNLSVGAFNDCDGLKYVTIGKDSADINPSAFSDCDNILSFSVDKGNKYYASIEGVLFDKEIKTVVRYPGGKTDSEYSIPESVKTIGHYAFRKTANLKSIKISKNVTSIGVYAFEGCSDLADISFGSNTNSIGSYAFEKTKWYSNMQDGLVYAGNVAYKYKGNIPNDTSIALKAGTKGIASEAFKDFSKLINIAIPNGVSVIGDSAFMNCYNLSGIDLPKSIRSIGMNAFYECVNLSGTVNIPTGVTEIKPYTFYLCRQIDEINIPESVTEIGSSAFYECRNMKSIVIPDGVTEISGYTFKDSGLISIVIPNSVTKIYPVAFYGCYGLEVYYKGTKAEWGNIEIGEDNSPLLYATIHYNYSHKHTAETTTTPATAENDGKSVTVCTVCGETLKTESISKPSSFKLSKTSYIYNGKTQKPAVTVKDSKGKTLSNGKDYTVSYSSSCKNTGKYSVTVTLKGNYSGSKTLYFNILPSKTSKLTATQTTSSIKATWKAVTGASGYKVTLYTAKNKAVKTVYTTKTSTSFTKLSKGTTYKVKVTAYKTIDGKKVLSGVNTLLTTTTKPGAPTLTVTAGAKKATLKWNKQTGATGYIVYMATSKSGKYTKIATLKGNSKISYTKTGLTKGKTYYFKVCAYTTAGGKNVNGAYSAVKSAKIK